MRGKKCLKKSFWRPLFAVLLAVLLASCSVCCSTASALELTGGNALELKSGTVTTGNGTINATKSHSDLIFQVNANFVYQLDFDYSDTAIPANDYLLTFSVTYKSVYGVAGGSNYTGHYRYDGLQSETMNKLSESCTANDETPVTTQGNGGVPVWYGEGQLTCSYLFFSHAGYDSFSSHQDSRIWYTETNGSGSQIIVTPGFVRGINFNALTDDDRAWLEEVLADSATDVSSVVSKLNEVKAEQQATTRAVEAQTRQQHEDYENEVDREEAKEDELNDQKDDLNISAQNPGNPFANLFNVSGCVNLPVFSQWFHQDHVTQVCSPYPEQTRPVIEFVSSVIVIGLLIRIYFKNFKGGYAS